MCMYLTLVSPGQVVILVVAQLFSTMCVVQGMTGTSLLQENKTAGLNAAHAGGLLTVKSG